MGRIGSSWSGLRARFRAEPEIPAALLDLLAAPDSHAPLLYDKAGRALVEAGTGTRFPVLRGIPVLIRAGDAADNRPTETANGSDFGSRYDDVIRNPRMQALYGDSGYFNVGLWDAGASSLPEACDCMVDALAEAIAPRARTILDVGCGRGAGTARIGRLFPEARVVAVNISVWQLEEARGRGTPLAVASDAARLGFADGIADAVIACESAEHFDTREDFLREAWRVLKPGGTLAMADMLFRDRAPVGEWMLPNASDPASADDYAGLLRAAGFADVRVRDETARTWLPFCAEMARVYEGQEEVLQALRDSLSCYLLASARKPG